MFIDDICKLNILTTLIQKKDNSVFSFVKLFNEWVIHLTICLNVELIKCSLIKFGY